MALSVKKYIDNLRNFDRTSDFISMVSLARHCGKQQPPISLRKLITGSCAGEQTGSGQHTEIPSDEAFGFPPQPTFIKFTPGIGEFIIDFTNFNDGYPTIHIPEQNLPLLPRYPNSGDPILPSFCCGFMLELPDYFFWHDGTKTLGEIPFDPHPIYVSTPNSKSIHNEDVGFGATIDSVEFSGPIGNCAGGKDWYFATPLTQRGRLDINNRNVILHIYFSGDIVFLSGQHDDSQIFKHLKKMEKKLEYYDKWVEDAMKNAMKWFAELGKSDDDRVQSIYAWLNIACKQDPIKCKKGWERYLPQNP